MLNWTWKPPVSQYMRSMDMNLFILSAPARASGLNFMLRTEPPRTFIRSSLATDRRVAVGPLVLRP